MEKVALMSWSDSNMAGDYWKWFITLTIRKNGTYSVGATQTSVDSPTYRLPSIYPLRNGRQVREALEELFHHDALCNDELNWDEINSVLSKHAPEIVKGIKETFSEEIRLVIDEERKSKDKEHNEKHITDWVNQATWEKSNISHHIARQMDIGKRKIAVTDYVRNYYLIWGRFPTGTHSLSKELIVNFPKT